MPIVSRSLHGITAGVAPANPRRPCALRGNVDGWSPQACARNTAWLRTVDHTALDGLGVAFTGTCLSCPPTHAEWHALQRSFVERLRRMGMLRMHWVIEWQRRGVPHLHAAVYFPHPSTPSEHASLLTRIEAHWLAVAAPFGAQKLSQTVKPIFDMGGWAQYVAKHASRGVSHYQRSKACQPKHWEKTGRIWGHLGNWPTVDPEKLDVSHACFYRFRRLCRSFRLADARAMPQRTDKERQARRRRIRSARRSLRCPYRLKSPLRGVSEWIPGYVQSQLVAHLLASGYEIQPHVKPRGVLAPRQSRVDPAARRSALTAELRAS